jgi:nucleoid-associated protein YgaU
MTASGRALLIVVAVTAGLAGFVASRFVFQSPASPPMAAPATQEPRGAPPPAAPGPAPAPGPTAVAPSAAPSAPAASAAARAPAATPEPPRFDVVRVGARGSAVIAGRAAPGAEVVLLEDGQEIARARADARGEWVILPPEPLRPGTRRFTLLARLGGEERAGADTVVVVVPEPAPAIAETPRVPAVTAETRREPEPAREPAAGPAAAATAEPRHVSPRPEETRVAARSVEEVRPAAPPQPAPAGAQPLVVLLPGTQPVARVLQGPAPHQGLALGQVDYDEAGAIRFAGTAAPGSTVRLYVNDRHTGDARADEQGRWSLAPGEAVAIGRHRLRVDQLAAAGAVAARIEVPFQRDRLPESETADGRVIVQPGHSLWRLARSVYGRGVRYTVIYDANRDQIRNPHRIFPGQVFAMPGMTADGAPPAPADSSRSR